MYSIGIRVSVQQKQPLGKIYFAIVHLDEDDELEIIRVSYLNIPVAVDVPEKLAFIRTNFWAIVKEFDIQLGALRVTETIASNPLVYRMNIEGVLQELFANSSIEKYKLLNIAKLGSIFGERKEIVKSQIKSGDNFADIEDWDTYKSEERECIMTAIAMIQSEVE